MILYREQRPVRRSKRPEWSIYVVVESDGYSGRVFKRNPRDMSRIRDLKNTPIVVTKDYMYLNTTRMYKKNGILYIIVGSGKNKEVHRHDMSRVKEIYKREYKREGVQ